LKTKAWVIALIEQIFRYVFTIRSYFKIFITCKVKSGVIKISL